MTDTPSQVTESRQPTAQHEIENPASLSSEIMAIHHTQVSRWSGKLPRPEDFNAYTETTQAWILSDSEKESEHRRALQRTELNADIEGLRRAQAMTFVISLLIIIISGALVWQGYPYGIAFALIGFLPVLATFLEKLKEIFGFGAKNANESEETNENSDKNS